MGNKHGKSKNELNPKNIKEKTTIPIYLNEELPPSFNELNSEKSMEMSKEILDEPKNIKRGLNKQSSIAINLSPPKQNSNQDIRDKRVQKSVPKVHSTIPSLKGNSFCFNLIDSVTPEEKQFVNHIFLAIDILKSGKISHVQLRDCQYFFSHPLKSRIIDVLKANKIISENEVSAAEFIKAYNIFYPKTPIAIKTSFLFRMIDYDEDERINTSDLINFYSELFWKENEEVDHYYTLNDITTLAEAFIGKYDKEGFNNLSFNNFQDVLLEEELKIWMNISPTTYIYIEEKP